MVVYSDHRGGDYGFVIKKEARLMIQRKCYKKKRKKTRRGKSTSGRNVKRGNIAGRTETPGNSPRGEGKENITGAGGKTGNT